jgi:hypothetical protein
MQQLFPFSGGGWGWPRGQCEAGWRRWLACSASVRQEEEGGRWAKRLSGSAGCWAD